MNTIKNLKAKWSAIWNPNMFHGWGRTKGYFEGWYYKLVDHSESNVFAVIPGISYEKNGDSHCFIQLLDGKNQHAEYFEFPTDHFHADNNNFTITIGENHFSLNRISLNLPEIKADLQFSNIYPWPKMLRAPGIMGWYSFVPFMECYHGIMSMNHYIDGTFEYKGTQIPFNRGIGYMEKDWGTSFPFCWIWTQCNHFEGYSDVSIFASVAKIPWLGSFFVGYIVGFLIDGTLYKFATYTGAMMKAEMTEEQVNLQFKDRKKRIEIVANKADGAELKSPISGQMTGKINESIQATLEVKLFMNEDLIFHGNGRNGGLEVGGEVDVLLTDQWRR